jgi:hypothetical protein
MSKRLNKLFTKIAQKHLLVDTLEPRNLDRLDFHDCSVRGIKDALDAAYVAGFEAGEKHNRTKVK